MSSKQTLQLSLVLIASRSEVDPTRFQAIKRSADILQHQHEIFVWLICKSGAEVKDHVDALRSKAKLFREAVNSPSDLETLDRIALLLECHAVGQELIKLSGGTILMAGPFFEVEWQGLREFSTKDVENWDAYFQYLLDSTLCVI